ncbi:MAG: M48 family metallopeptidase [bacterium]
MTTTGLIATSPVADVIRQLAGRMSPIRLSLAYRLGLVVVAGVLLTLVAAYLALIVAVVVGVAWHLGEHVDWLSFDRLDIWAFELSIVAYVGPVIAGLVLALLLLKPLFAPPPARSRGHRLSRAQEPVLYAYVEQLARYVGAPLPHSIQVTCDVNAFASLRSGGALRLGRQLVLTIGLPLAAGLDLRELTGVLAHELGHFSQGAGLRLMTLVRGVSLWFARMAFERDGWDEALARTALAQRGSTTVTLALLLTRLTIGMARAVCAVFVVLGHAASVGFVREMERDADRYEVEIAGSAGFERALVRLHLLRRGFADARAMLASAWASRKLADNLPRLVADRAARLEKGEIQAVRKQVLSGKSRWLDTHPSPGERIRQARRASRDGVVSSALPGTALFRDFDALARTASLVLYRAELGQEIRLDHLVSREHLDERRALAEHALAAFGRFFGDPDDGGELGMLDGGRPSPPASAGDAVRALASARAAVALASGAATAGGGEASLRSSAESRERACTRIHAALDALAFPDIAARLASDAGSVIDRATYLRRVVAALDDQRELSRALGAAADYFARHIAGVQAGNTALTTLLVARVSATQIQLRQLQERLASVPVLDDGRGPSASLGERVVPSIPPVDDVMAIARETRDARLRMHGFHVRALGELALLAERVEAALGFDASPDDDTDGPSV